MAHEALSAGVHLASAVSACVRMSGTRDILELLGVILGVEFLLLCTWLRV